MPFPVAPSPFFQKYTPCCLLSFGRGLAECHQTKYDGKLSRKPTRWGRSVRTVRMTICLWNQAWHPARACSSDELAHGSASLRAAVRMDCMRNTLLTFRVLEEQRTSGKRAVEERVPDQDSDREKGVAGKDCRLLVHVRALEVPVISKRERTVRVVFVQASARPRMATIVEFAPKPPIFISLRNLPVVISHNGARNLAFEPPGLARRFAVVPIISNVESVVIVHDEFVDHKQKAAVILAELEVAAARAGFMLAIAPHMTM